MLFQELKLVSWHLVINYVVQGRSESVLVVFGVHHTPVEFNEHCKFLGTSLLLCDDPWLLHHAWLLAEEGLGGLCLVLEEARLSLCALRLSLLTKQ